MCSRDRAGFAVTYIIHGAREGVSLWGCGGFLLARRMNVCRVWWFWWVVMVKVVVVGCCCGGRDGVALQHSGNLKSGQDRWFSGEWVGQGKEQGYPTVGDQLLC